MSRYSIAVALAVIGGLLGLSSSAHAGVYNYWFEGLEWGSPDWTMVGNAFYADDGALTPSKRLRLTSAGNGQVGASWLNADLLSPGQDWNVFMRGQVTYRGGGGADGMGFIWQTDGLGANPGFEGGGLSGAFLAFSLDSWQNAGEAFGNALEIHSSGGQIAALDIGDALERDDFFNLTVNYDDPTNTLSVTFDSDALAPVTGSWNVDLTALFGPGARAYVGFAGNTGGANENHDVLQTFITAVPEPASLALLAAGVLPVLRRRRGV